MLRSLIYFILCMSISQACVDLEPDPTAGFTEMMTATVEGMPFDAALVTMEFIDGNKLTISGVSTDSTRIELRLSGITTKGVFSLDEGSKYEAIFINEGKREFTSRATMIGTIDISTLNQVTAVGTFSFVANNATLGTLNVINGVFSAERD